MSGERRLFEALARDVFEGPEYLRRCVQEGTLPSDAARGLAVLESNSEIDGEAVLHQMGVYVVQMLASHLSGATELSSSGRPVALVALELDDDAESPDEHVDYGILAVEAVQRSAEALDYADPFSNG